jgi:hypothetical protein
MIVVTREEIEQRMNELARKYLEAHDPKIPYELYKLACELEEIEKESSDQNHTCAGVRISRQRIMSHRTDVNMRPGDRLKTSRPIRSQKTGTLLPREGTFVRAVENLGRKLILVNFGTAGDEYLFPEEILAERV